MESVLKLESVSLSVVPCIPDVVILHTLLKPRCI